MHGTKRDKIDASYSSLLRRLNNNSKSVQSKLIICLQLNVWEKYSLDIMPATDLRFFQPQLIKEMRDGNFIYEFTLNKPKSLPALIRLHRERVKDLSSPLPSAIIFNRAPKFEDGQLIINARQVIPLNNIGEVGNEIFGLLWDYKRVIRRNGNLVKDGQSRGVLIKDIVNDTSSPSVEAAIKSIERLSMRLSSLGLPITITTEDIRSGYRVLVLTLD